MRTRYTQEMKEFILNNADGRTNKQLIALFNNKFGTQITERAINSYKKSHNIKCIKASRVGYNSMFSKAIRDFIDDNCIGIVNKALADMINAKFGTNYNREQIKNYKSRHKISSGLNGQFQKGHETHNKGKKMPPEIYAKCKETMFKKGQMPSNHKEVGSERVNVDGYIEIKIAEPNVWDLKHRVIWRNTNGPINDEDRIVFLDGDQLNISIDNLSLITNRELLELNRKGLIKDNADLTKVGILIAKLNVATKINRRS